MKNDTRKINLMTGLRLWLILAAMVVTISSGAVQPTAAQTAAIQTKMSEQEFNRAFTHHKTVVNGINLHYVMGGKGEPLVLLHGFPQTWYEWHSVMPALAQKYTLIVPDMRGAGDSEKPVGGYDKRTMATDIRTLVRQLGYEKINLFGHDIGMMVAYAYAAQYPAEVRQLVMAEVPLPGIGDWDKMRLNPLLWHFSFFGKQDVPEMLIAGQERVFITAFMSEVSVNPEPVLAGMDEYARAFALPGGARAHFEYYRAFEQDAKDNQEFVKTKLTMPILLIGAEASIGGTLPNSARLVGTDVQSIVVPRSGHYIAEEQPEYVVEQLFKFFDKNRASGK